MGLLDSLLGNASGVTREEIQTQLAPILIPGEEIERGYKVFRDLFVFTSKRLVLVDIQGMTGSKVEYHSVPYSSITSFAVETAGSFDRDAELKLWVRGRSAPIQKQFAKNSSNIDEVARTLGTYLLD